MGACSFHRRPQHIESFDCEFSGPVGQIEPGEIHSRNYRDLGLGRSRARKRIARPPGEAVWRYNHGLFDILPGLPRVWLHHIPSHSRDVDRRRSDAINLDCLRATNPNCGYVLFSVSDDLCLPAFWTHHWPFYQHTILLKQETKPQAGL
jgi:hypothetical protein